MSDTMETTADKARFILVMIAFAVVVLCAVWDIWFTYVDKSHLTISRIVKEWRTNEPILIVAASFVFYHLFIEP